MSPSAVDGVSDSYDLRVEPAGFVIQVRSGEPVMDAAHRQGYRWPNVCGGQAICGTCLVRVLEGANHLAAMEERERTRLRMQGRSRRPEVRLACQLKIHGAVSVFKRGVREPAALSGLEIPEEEKAAGSYPARS